MSIYLPIKFDEKNNKFIIALSSKDFDVIQILFFSAEKYIDEISLSSMTEHRFDEVILFRENHLLNYRELLVLSIRELDLLTCIIDTGLWHIYQPMGDYKTIDDFISEDQSYLRREMVAVLKKLNKVLCWKPDPANLYIAN